MSYHDEEEERQKKYRLNEEIQGRLNLLNRYKEKPSTKEEEEERQKKLEYSGINTFISYADLADLASQGEQFLLHPNAENDDLACISCGDGNLYKASTFDDLRLQLDSALEKNPNNKYLLSGLERIDQEIQAASSVKNKGDNEQTKANLMTKANLIDALSDYKPSDPKTNENNHEQEETQQERSTPFSTNPFLKKPKT